MQNWQMQTTKARFWELLRHATREGPQNITVDGQSVAVIVSRELFDRLSGNEQSLADFMRASPLADQDGIEFERDRGLPREVSF
ncbi:MAG: type II toxin-antitoxin system prevent-host-death family antitoxin [Candidatus Accumulibacter sp.]|jgi:prevent-host-death family protein|nr:type II toxin-antitoxin system prevent-host-death family antitoxin [Accumulibacter sp.]